MDREQLTRDIRDALEELKFLRAASQFDPEQADVMLARAVVLLGSAALLLGCPETFGLD